MNTSALVVMAVLGLAFVIVVGVLIFYALRNKGDVRAEFSHGSTMFRLEAMERPVSAIRGSGKLNESRRKVL